MDKTEKSRVLLLLAIAVLASTAAVAADLISQWSPDYSPRVFGSLKTATFDNVPGAIEGRYLMYRERESSGILPGSAVMAAHRDFTASHYLALFFLPLGMLGIPALIRGDGLLQKAGRLTAYLTYIWGLAYHLSMSLLGEAYLNTAPSQWGAVTAGFTSYMTPMGYGFSIGFAAVSLIYFVSEWLRTGRPVVRAWINPLFIMILLIVIGLPLRPAAAAVLNITSFNLALFFTYALHLIIEARKPG